MPRNPRKRKPSVERPDHGDDHCRNCMRDKAGQCPRATCYGGKTRPDGWCTYYRPKNGYDAARARGETT